MWLQGLCADKEIIIIIITGMLYIITILKRIVDRPHTQIYEAMVDHQQLKVSCVTCDCLVRLAEVLEPLS